MSKVVISSYQDFEPYIGKELGVSDYLTITQEQINLFADATLDHQWIHVDEKKAKAESPYKATIAHGYLTVSLLPVLWAQIVDVQNTKLLVNYGIEKLKFNQAVTVGSDVRVRATLVSAVNLRGVIKAEIGVTMEIKDSNKPAFQGSVIFLYHFN
ncbi:MAG: acyl dehydratase [Bacteroidetes bacterium]|jgi:acyl dehydratase|nr:acyl dehydratase [Bacteroidota bacterium]